MNPVLLLVIGAAIAAVSGLVSPFVARLWLKADQRAERARDRDAALRQGVEDYLAVLWLADARMSASTSEGFNNLSPDQSLAALDVVSEIQRAEAHVGLLLTKEQEPIYVLIVKYAQLVIDRDRPQDPNAPDALPLRQEVITRLSRWLNGDEDATEAKNKFDAFVLKRQTPPPAL